MVFVNKSNTFYLKTFTSNDILRLYATYCSTKGSRRCLMSNVKSLRSKVIGREKDSENVPI